MRYDPVSVLFSYIPLLGKRIPFYLNYLKRKMRKWYLQLTDANHRPVSRTAEAAALKQTINGISHLGSEHSTTQATTIEAAFGSCDNNEHCAELAVLFSGHGSDKSTAHNYHLAYACPCPVKQGHYFAAHERSMRLRGSVIATKTS